MSSGLGLGGGEVAVVSDQGVDDVGLAAGEADEFNRLCCFDGSPSCGKAEAMRRNRRARPPVPAPSAFAGFRFRPVVILLAVRWYLR